MKAPETTRPQGGGLLSFTMRFLLYLAVILPFRALRWSVGKLYKLLKQEYNETPVFYTIFAAQLALFTLIALPGGNRIVEACVFTPRKIKQYWRLISYSLIHANLPHLLLNLGRLTELKYLEEHIGSSTFFVMYLCCAVGGVAIPWYFGATTTVIGCSGALMGMGMYSLQYNSHSQTAAYLAYLLRTVADLFLIITNPIALWCHLCGALTGMVFFHCQQCFRSSKAPLTLTPIIPNTKNKMYYVNTGNKAQTIPKNNTPPASHTNTPKKVLSAKCLI